MKGQMIVIPDSKDGTLKVTDFDNPPTLEQMQAALGGYLEAVPFFDELIQGSRADKCVVFCDEDGKLKKGLKENTRATAAWKVVFEKRTRHTLTDRLVGPVIVLVGDDEFLAAL